MTAHAITRNSITQWGQQALDWFDRAMGDKPATTGPDDGGWRYDRSEPVPGMEPLGHEHRNALLAGAVQRYARDGWHSIGSAGPYQVQLAKGKRPSHLLHLAMTVLTGGLWLLVWVPIWMFSGTRYMLLTVDEHGRSYTQKTRR